MKYFFKTLLAISLVFIFTSTILYAAENNPGDNTVVSLEESINEPALVSEPATVIIEAESQIDVDSKASTEEDDFIPSVRITEDLPVTFPIDI